MDSKHRTFRSLYIFYISTESVVTEEILSPLLLSSNGSVPSSSRSFLFHPVPYTLHPLLASSERRVRSLSSGKKRERARFQNEANIKGLIDLFIFHDGSHLQVKSTFQTYEFMDIRARRGLCTSEKNPSIFLGSNILNEFLLNKYCLLLNFSVACLLYGEM